MTVITLIPLGLVLGSFVNAFVWRLYKKKNWVNDRSECDSCHHKLGASDLIPVVSWVLLRGKCRYCRKPIKDSPLTELALPVLFVVSYIWWPLSLQGEGLLLFVFWLVFLVGFTVLAVYDIRWFLLPNKIVFPLIGVAVLQVVLQVFFFDASPRDVLGAALGIFFISGIFYVLFVLSKGTWIGFGDVKLGIVLGILAGGPLTSMLLLFVASMLGVLISIPMVIAGKAGRKTLIPFGPF
ncbi:MAG TPA: prepilin peptidase, partial [Candidatus Saccharimonadales bacterium]|nr:prepilin peptidase [Candidatus Saccharimonadales bacterium]